MTGSSPQDNHYHYPPANVGLHRASRPIGISKFQSVDVLVVVKESGTPAQERHTMSGTASQEPITRWA